MYSRVLATWVTCPGHSECLAHFNTIEARRSYMILFEWCALLFVLNRNRVFERLDKKIPALVYRECTNLLVRCTPLTVFIPLASQVATATQLFIFLLTSWDIFLNPRYRMKAESFFSRPLVPAFLSSGKYRNCFKENVIVGAEQDNFEVFLWYKAYSAPIITLQFVYRYTAF